MIWSRRSFLKLSLTAAGVVLTADVTPSLVKAASPAFRTTIHMLRVWTVGAEDGVTVFRLARAGGEVILQAPLNSRGGAFCWYAVPGGEIVWGNGLENRSDADVRIDEIRFTCDDHRYVWMDGHVFSVEQDAPPAPFHLPHVTA